MLRKLPENDKQKWHLDINKMLFAYNAIKHDRTGYSPYYLMSGREPILPIDLILGIEDHKDATTYTDFAQSWQNQMNMLTGQPKRIQKRGSYATRKS